MSQALPQIYLARHGETAWSLSGQHTGRTDLPLTERGERNARRLGQRLQGRTFARVFTSPLQVARVAPVSWLAFREWSRWSILTLVEWNYAALTRVEPAADIRKERPDWDLFRDGGAERRECGRHVEFLGSHRVTREYGRLTATS